MEYSSEDIKALPVNPKCTAVLSIYGSSFKGGRTPDVNSRSPEKNAACGRTRD
jgi:hypothetical protein